MWGKRCARWSVVDVCISCDCTRKHHHATQSPPQYIHCGGRDVVDVCIYIHNQPPITAVLLRGHCLRLCWTVGWISMGAHSRRQPTKQDMGAKATRCVCVHTIHVPYTFPLHTTPTQPLGYPGTHQNAHHHPHTYNGLLCRAAY